MMFFNYLDRINIGSAGLRVNQDLAFTPAMIWMPQIIKSLGALSDIEVGFLSALPPALGVVGTILAGISSDRTGDRKFHPAGFIAATMRVTPRIAGARAVLSPEAT